MDHVSCDQDFFTYRVTLATMYKHEHNQPSLLASVARKNQHNNGSSPGQFSVL
jgi:hypothetical protein